MTGTAKVHWIRRPSWQRFMLGYFVIYIIFSAVLLRTLGPIGMSHDYLADHKLDHDRYLETTKLDEYKRWKQRPALLQPDTDLADRIAFVDEYTRRADFLSEQRRRAFYDVAADVFRVLMVLVLIIHFGRKPIAGILEGFIDNVRNSLEGAREQRVEAEANKKGAQQKLYGLADEQLVLETEAAQRIEDMRRQAALSTGQSLAIMNRETQDRIQREEDLARAQLKLELLDAAIDTIAQRAKTHASPTQEAALVEQFVHHLKDMA